MAAVPRTEGFSPPVRQPVIMVDSEHLKPGSIIDDRYVVEEHIGTGGYSQVVAARDRTTDQSVAVKVLHAEATSRDPRAVDRMRQEAEILRAVDHPNIVRILEVGSFDGGQFLVMEYIEGVGLTEFLEQKGRLETSTLLPMVRQLLQALASAHGTEILHRDLKPDNILVTDDDQAIKLVDFGVAKAGALLNADDPDEGITLVKTRSGTFVGTPRYAAPEMVVGDPLDPAADLFCVGLIVYEALVGRPLIEGTSKSEKINELVFPRPFDLEEVPTPWDEWLAPLLEKSPDHRTSTAEEALRQLDELFGDSASAASTLSIADPVATDGDDPGDDDVELHPAFGDEPPATQAEGPPDFAAMDAAVDPEAETIERQALDVRQIDDDPKEDEPWEDEEKWEPELDRPQPTSASASADADLPANPSTETDDEPTSQDRDRPSVIGSVVLFVLLAVATFAVAYLLVF